MNQIKSPLKYLSMLAQLNNTVSSQNITKFPLVLYLTVQNIKSYLFTAASFISKYLYTMLHT